MTDQEFMQAFEAATLNEFAHRDHVRMAWLYLRKYGTEAGLVKIREGIQAFARSVGADHKYHETITVFWARVVLLGIADRPEIEDFAAFIQVHSHVLDKGLLQRHYSNAVLASETARRAWVEPDLIPLPAMQP